MRPALSISAEAIEALIVRARESGQPQLVRAHVPLDRTDPWELLGHPELQGRRVFAWNDDQRKLCFLAVEVLHTFNADGIERFAQCQRWTQGISACTTELWGQTTPSPGLPLVCGGFRFDPGPPNSDSPWADWGDGVLWLAHSMVVKAGGDSRLIVSDWVHPGDTAKRVIGELKRNTARLLSAITEGRPAQPTQLAVSERDPTRDAVDRWLHQVEQAKREMSDHTLDKVVLARSQHWQSHDHSAFDPFATVTALRKRQSRCTTFAFCDPEHGAFVGSTPELLVERAGDTVRTVALAGTAKRGPKQSVRDIEQALLNSAKDRHEQALVTESICASLNNLLVHVSCPEQPNTIVLADLIHLETPIEGPIGPNTTLFSLLDRLHPTPAVGGLPQRHALQWIRDNESMDRGWYAAPIGWVAANGDGRFVVALRSVLLRGTRAWAFAGCGLVPKSVGATEWEETWTKLEVVRHGLSVGQRP